MIDLLRDIADTADELTNPRQNVERIHDTDRHRNRRIRRVWTVTLPSLLDQLAAAAIPGEAYTEDEPVRGAFASKPPARLDAVDRLITITAAANGWCRRANLTPRPAAAGNIRGLVGAAPALDSGTQAALLGDLRAWRTWAATVTGWERPPDAPRAPCPACSKPNTLRVRLARSTACCMACGAWWDHTTIGVLAEHIRSYAETSLDTRELRAAAVAARRAYDARRRAHEPQPDLPRA